MPAPTKPCVLVADDEARIRDILAGYLEADGFEVVLAGDGEEALRRARERKPDVVVLDVMMPGLDGVEVLRRLRTESDVYVILLTAKSDEVDKLVGLSMGADDYVTKPFSPASWWPACVPCSAALGSPSPRPRVSASSSKASPSTSRAGR